MPRSEAITIHYSPFIVHNGSSMGFETFLGNPQAVSVVREMLASERVPGALLLAGPDGVGKKTLALMLAKALNCERFRDDFCGECWHCRKAEEMLAAVREDLDRRRQMKDSARRAEGLVYFDLQLIEPITRYILIEQVRQLRNIAYTRPFELRRRVLIVDQAQTVHWQAVDLLLKVLEEPPDTTTLILVCPNAFELRSTIRSRCSQLQFVPVEDAVVAKLLEKEGRVNASRRALAVRAVGGSVAKAKTFDPAEFERRRKPWVDFFDAVGRAGKPAEVNWRALFDSTKALTEDRENFEETLSMGYSLLRDLIYVLESNDDPRVTHVDLLPHFKAWAPRLGLAGLEKLKDGLDDAYRSQIRNANQQLGLEALAIDLLTRAG
jgi:DNA polymerase III subunit delta'